MTMQCKVCHDAMHQVFSALVLHKHKVAYYRCTTCGLIQTEKPYWLDEAYSDAIAMGDTGLVSRNISIALRLAPLLQLIAGRGGRYLDVAGGYGMLVRLMRDFGFDYWWYDKYCANLLAKGFEATDASAPYAAVTAFEVLEHVEDPCVFIAETMRQHGCDTLIFSTELYVGETAPLPTWWYYAFEGGQHISFFQRRTLEKMAERLSLHFATVRGIHILSRRRLPPVWLLTLGASSLAPFLTVMIKRLRGSLTVSDNRALAQKGADAPPEK